MKFNKDTMKELLQKLKDSVSTLWQKLIDFTKTLIQKKDATNVTAPKNKELDKSIKGNKNELAKSFLVRNKNFIIMGLIFVIMIFAIVTITSKSNKSNQATSADKVITLGESTAGDDSSQAGVANALQENAYPEVNDLVNKYYSALAQNDMDTLLQIVDKLDDTEQAQIKQKREYIEAYNNITCYTKVGPEDGSYVVFVYYEIKFVNINTLVPGLTPLYICTNEDGKLYIYNGELDPEVESYITNLANGDDVKSLLNSVDTKYQEAQTKDPDLKAFVEKLATATTDQQTTDSQTTQDQVAQATSTQDQASQDQAAQAAQDQSAQATQDQAAQTQTAGETYQDANETLYATETINIRSSASETGDKLGLLYEGEPITRTGVGSNGWSRVSYNGKEGYVLSQYLTATGAVTEIMYVQETVKMRAEANENSDRVGTVYAGTKVTRTAKYDNGWSRIIVDGVAGYIKSSYLDTNYQ